jgi:hypothetical protein
MTKNYTSDGEAHLRRYSPRGPPPYYNSHDRYRHNAQPDSLRHSSRGYSLPNHDSQHSEDSELHGKPNRRRIPVAVRHFIKPPQLKPGHLFNRQTPADIFSQCGRCRKRKIRCSGPQGGEGGCQNCKTAGNPDCQFNRVSVDDCHPFSPRLT